MLKKIFNRKKKQNLPHRNQPNMFLSNNKKPPSKQNDKQPKPNRDYKNFTNKDIPRRTFSGR